MKQTEEYIQMSSNWCVSKTFWWQLRFLLFPVIAWELPREEFWQFVLQLACKKAFFTIALVRAFLRKKVCSLEQRENTRGLQVVLQWKHSQWHIPYRAAARFASAFSFFNRFVFEKFLEDCPASKENPKNNIFSLCNLATHLTTISNDFPMIPTHVKLNFVTEKNWNKSVWWSSWKTHWKISDV